MEPLLIGLAFLLGSIPFGLLITRAFAGQDVRASGSGNIGATNVARVAGKKLGALVLLLDAAKGALVVLLALRLFPQGFTLHALVGYAAFLGHVFPPWLRFKGGKGVATAMGVLAVLLPWSALAGFLVWLLVLAVLRVSSVGSLGGGLVALVVAFFQGAPAPYAALAVALLLSMLFTHRGNISRLLARKENRV